MAVIKNKKTGMWEVRTYYKDLIGEMLKTYYIEQIVRLSEYEFQKIYFEVIKELTKKEKFTRYGNLYIW